MIPLGTLGGQASTAFGINSAGKVVGSSSTTGTSNERAFRYSSGSMSNLGTLGGTSSTAFDINDSDQIVGSSTTPGNAANHAFIHENNQMRDLNTMVDASGAGWVLKEARAINRFGHIVGYGTNPQGFDRAFLLRPIPEPATFALCLAAGLLVLRRPRRGSRA